MKNTYWANSGAEQAKYDEIMKAIEGREQRDVMPVLDELMDTLSFIQPRLYSAVMNKLA